MLLGCSLRSDQQLLCVAVTKETAFVPQCLNLFAGQGEASQAWAVDTMANIEVTESQAPSQACSRAEAKQSPPPPTWIERVSCPAGSSHGRERCSSTGVGPSSRLSYGRTGRCILVSQCKRPSLQRDLFPSHSAHIGSLPHGWTESAPFRNICTRSISDELLGPAAFAFATGAHSSSGNSLFHSVTDTTFVHSSVSVRSSFRPSTYTQTRF